MVWKERLASLFQDDEAVEVWRGRLGRSFRDAFRVFRRFHREVLAGHPVFGKMRPSELVDWQANARGRDVFVLKDLAQKWIDGHRWRYKTKATYLGMISSFWLHNHAPLPPDPGFHFSSDIPPVEGKLTFEAFRRIVLNSNKSYRAVFLMMAGGLMGARELVYVSNNCWREVLQHLSKNDGVFSLVLPGRKKNRNVKNFCVLLSTDGDWAEAHREYMKSSQYPILGALFRNTRGHPLTENNIQHYFRSRAIETGIVKQFSPKCRECGHETLRFRKRRPSYEVGYRCRKCGNVDWASEFDSHFTNVRYGISPHEIRDLTRSRWQVSGADPLVAEFLMGHDIDPNAYNKFMKYEPWYLVQEYRKALPWLNVTSQNPSKVDRFKIDDEIESHRVEINLLRKELGKKGREIKELRDQLKGVAWLASNEKVEKVVKGLKLLRQLEKKRQQDSKTPRS